MTDAVAGVFSKYLSKSKILKSVRQGLPFSHCLSVSCSTETVVLGGKVLNLKLLHFSLITYFFFQSCEDSVSSLAETLYTILFFKEQEERNTPALISCDITNNSGYGPLASCLGHSPELMKSPGKLCGHTDPCAKGSV